MKLHNYLYSLPRDKRAEFAKSAGTTVGYLVQLANGHRNPSPDLCKRLELASSRELSKEELRPDIWPRSN